MRISTDLTPNAGFTKVPNEVIDSDLTNAEFRLWVKMLADLKGEPERVFHNVKQAAETYGMKPDAFRDQRRGLKAKGFISGDAGRMVVTIPAPDFKPTEVVAEAELCSIAVEQKQQAKRKATLKKAERKTLIREAWNKHKLDNDLWIALEGSLPEPAYNAIEAHTKFLQLDRDDYDAFIGRVLRGAAVDPFWSQKRKSAVKLWSIFGWVEYHTNDKGPTDAMFRRVKELYRLGGTSEAKDKAFDGSDEAFVKWYQDKGLTQFTKVERIVVEDAIEASSHELQTTPTDTILVYQAADGKLLHWTYKYKHNSIAYLPS